MLRDVPFLPTERPSPGGVAVEQVIVAGDALAADFQVLADRATLRGIPTVLRTVSWIDSSYTGTDRPARIRAFLRDAHDLWGTEYAVLGGDVEHVPTRYIPWQDVDLPTDYYYECLDGEWNEDGDAIFAEPLLATNLAGFVNDVAVAPDGRIWAGTNLGVTVLDNGSFTLHDKTGGLPSDEVMTLDAAADGSVWIGTTEGVARWNGTAWAAWDSTSGLPSNDILSIRAFSATDVWAGTNLGLAHWNGAAWTTYTVADGLPSDAITALAG
ncbi:MAG: hypothetical protein HKN12_01635, partial [Gemmatimonadetes bacterium]|nr:hypothetical protein [Gemmatimonadota bacterium]